MTHSYDFLDKLVSETRAALLLPPIAGLALHHAVARIENAPDMIALRVRIERMGTEPFFRHYRTVVAAMAHPDMAATGWLQEIYENNPVGDDHKRAPLVIATCVFAARSAFKLLGLEHLHARA